MGNPNVGKSVIFNRLTGIKVIASNYPGTTIEFLEGSIIFNGRKVRIIDAPGTYSLVPSDRAEEVAANLLTEEKTDLIINVVDATNLERNLYLTLQLRELPIPVIADLNMIDAARERGIEIDIPRLEKELGLPVVTSVAISGEGIGQLRRIIGKILQRSQNKVVIRRFDSEIEEVIVRIQKETNLPRWQVILGLEGNSDFRSKIPREIFEEAVGKIQGGKEESIELTILKWRFGQSGAIISRVQKVHHRHPTFLEKLGDATVKPLTGLPIAAIVLWGIFNFFVIGAGFITDKIMIPLFEGPYDRFVRLGVEKFFPRGFVHDMLVGTSGSGYLESFGLLTTGIFVPIGVVLPAVLIFYLILTLLEDIGYLPRLAVLVDNIFHKIGLHGYSIVPVILSFGCNVPGAMASRILRTEKQRFMMLTMLGISIPCTAQTAVVLNIIGPYGLKWVMLIYFILLVIFVSLGSILNYLLAGETPEIVLEIPPYRIPRFSNLLMKTRLRMESFFLDAIPWVLVGILVVNLFYYLGVTAFLSRNLGFLLGGWLGLPQEAIYPLIIGFLRKDVATGLIAPLLSKGTINLGQAVTIVVMLAVYFPCAATFVVFLKELGIKDTIKSTLIMLIVAFGVGGLLHLSFALKG